MDIMIFMIVSIFGLILTFLGFRTIEFAFFALLLNLINFGGILVDGLSQVIGYNSTGLVTQTFDTSIVVFVPIMFCIANFFVIVAYLRGR